MSGTRRVLPALWLTGGVREAGGTARTVTALVNVLGSLQPKPICLPAGLRWAPHLTSPYAWVMPEPTVRRTGPRRRWLTGVLMALALIVAFPLFRALYEAFDLFGLPGALGVLLLLAVVLGAAWLVHLFRTYGGQIAPIARSIAGSLSEAFTTSPYLSRLGRWLHGPASFLRRRLSPDSPSGLYLTPGATTTVLLPPRLRSITPP